MNESNDKLKDKLHIILLIGLIICFSSLISVLSEYTEIKDNNLNGSLFCLIVLSLINYILIVKNVKLIYQIYIIILSLIWSFVLFVQIKQFNQIIKKDDFIFLNILFFLIPCLPYWWKILLFTIKITWGILVFLVKTGSSQKGVYPSQNNSYPSQSPGGNHQVQYVSRRIRKHGYVLCKYCGLRQYYDGIEGQDLEMHFADAVRRTAIGKCSHSPTGHHVPLETRI